MYLCDYLETGFLNALRGTTLTAPQSVYIALFLADPGEQGSLANEIAYTGYARMPVVFTAPAAMNGGIGIQNQANISFAAPNAAAGTVTHIGIADSLTGGNLLARAELIEPLVVGANEPPVFLAGDVAMYLTNNLSALYKTKLLNVMRGVSIAGVTPYHSLWNGSPDASGAELSGDNYARVSITYGAPSEQTSGRLVVENSVAVTYPRPSTNWGTWTHSAVMNAASSGEAVFIFSRAEAKEIKRGYMPNFAIGALKAGVN